MTFSDNILVRELSLRFENEGRSMYLVSVTAVNMQQIDTFLQLLVLHKKLTHRMVVQIS